MVRTSILQINSPARAQWPQEIENMLESSLEFAVGRQDFLACTADGLTPIAFPPKSRKQAVLCRPGREGCYQDLRLNLR